MSQFYIEPDFVTDPDNPFKIFGLDIRDGLADELTEDYINNRYEQLLEQYSNDLEIQQKLDKSRTQLLQTYVPYVRKDRPMTAPPMTVPNGPPYALAFVEPNFDSDDPFEILGIPYPLDGLTIDDVNKRFKRLSIKYHPDKSKKTNASELFQKINSAKSDIIQYHFQISPFYGDDETVNFFPKEANESANAYYASTFSQPRSAFYNAEKGDIFKNIVLQTGNSDTTEKQLERQFVVHIKANHEGGTTFVKAYEWDPINRHPIYRKTPFTIMDETYNKTNINAIKVGETKTTEPGVYDLFWGSVGYGVKKSIKTRRSKTRRTIKRDTKLRKKINKKTKKQKRIK